MTDESEPTDRPTDEDELEEELIDAVLGIEHVSPEHQAARHPPAALSSHRPAPPSSHVPARSSQGSVFGQTRASKSLFGLIRPKGAVILLGLVCALAIVESIAAFLEYRERLSPDDWAEVDAMLARHEGEPVIVASEWLGPSARMNLARARSWDSLAFPDLRGFPRFWLLTRSGERPWRGALEAELEQSRRPNLVAVHTFGELTLHEYEQPVGAPLFSLFDALRSVSTERGRCSGRSGNYRCKDGRIDLRVIEIDYRARRCLALELGDGVMATLDLGELELGALAYGHVGFGDFNARLRADPTARVELLIDDAVAGRWVFTDDQGWAAFALATPPGPHHVALRIGATVAGTWQREGHRNNPTSSLCVELRGFEAGLTGGGPS